MRSIPISFLEQVLQVNAEAGQQIFFIEFAVGMNDSVLCQRAEDFGGLRFRINDPRELHAAGEEVPKAFGDLRAGVAGRQDLDGEIGRAGKKLT